MNLFIQARLKVDIKYVKVQISSDLKINMGKVPRKGRESANTSTFIRELEERVMRMAVADANGEQIHYLVTLNLSAIRNNLSGHK